MGKTSILKEYLRLVIEALNDHPKQAPLLNGPFVRSKSHKLYPVIYREFPLVATPEVTSMLGTGDVDVEGGVIWAEHEIIIDPDIYYQKGSRSTWSQSGDPEEFLVEDYTIESFNGFRLTDEDAAVIKDYVGELTDSEVDNIREWWGESNEPDYDEPDYDPY